MNKWKIGAIGIIVVAIVAIAIFYPMLDATDDEFIVEYSPQPGEYLHYREDYRGGEETKVLLVDSHLSYGVYEQDVYIPHYSVKEGDLCVIINGTVRNDYDKEYHIAITADVYNSKGEKVGYIIGPHAPIGGFTSTRVESDCTNSFVMHVRYDGKDIVRYDLFVRYAPSEVPYA